jgi:gamma-glutamylcysteine synthetase
MYVSVGKLSRIGFRVHAYVYIDRYRRRFHFILFYLFVADVVVFVVLLLLFCFFVAVVLLF